MSTESTSHDEGAQGVDPALADAVEEALSAVHDGELDLAVQKVGE